jgi:hypothetical protein
LIEQHRTIFRRLICFENDTESQADIEPAGEGLTTLTPLSSSHPLTR